eukprot:gene50792-23151_t
MAEEGGHRGAPHRGRLKRVGTVVRLIADNKLVKALPGASKDELVWHYLDDSVQETMTRAQLDAVKGGIEVVASSVTAMEVMKMRDDMVKVYESLLRGERSPVDVFRAAPPLSGAPPQEETDAALKARFASWKSDASAHIRRFQKEVETAKTEHDAEKHRGLALGSKCGLQEKEQKQQQADVLVSLGQAREKLADLLHFCEAQRTIERELQQAEQQEESLVHDVVTTQTMYKASRETLRLR